MSSVSSGPSRDVDDGLLPAPPEGRGSRMFGKRAVLISTASTIVFFAVVVVVVALSPGSAIVGERFFDWFHIRQSFVGTVSTPSVLGAFWVNIRMFVIAEVMILVFALVIAIVRSLSGPVFFPCAPSPSDIRTCSGESPSYSCSI